MMFSTSKIDDVDRRVLTALHADARISNSALAELVGNRPVDLPRPRPAAAGVGGDPGFLRRLSTPPRSG